jgi:hypothetical protein
VIRLTATGMLAIAVLLGPHLCCCSADAFGSSPAPNAPTTSCPHCLAKDASDCPETPCSGPIAPNCPLCELARTIPAWGTLPSADSLDLNDTCFSPILLFIDADESFRSLKTLASTTPPNGSFTHLHGVGILRALGRMRC